jgi:hypothetical protein
VHALHLDDEVVEAARGDRSHIGIVDQLEAEEGVCRQLQHGQAAELGRRHIADDDVPDLLVEIERTVEVTTRRPMCNVLILALPTAVPTNPSPGTGGG